MKTWQFSLLLGSVLLAVACAMVGADHLREPGGDALSVRILGPRDGLVGDLVVLSLQTTGASASQSWTIDPPAAPLVLLEDGRSVAFSSRQPGVYRVTCSVGSLSGQSAHTQAVVELLDAPPDQAISVEDLIAPPQPLDVGQLVRQWVAEVQDGQKPASGTVIAGTIRTLAARLASGQVQGDPLTELERSSEIAIGPEVFGHWQSFFVRLRGFVTPLNQAGVVQSNQQFAQLMNNLAPLVEAAVATP